MSKNISDLNDKLAKVMMANSADASEEEALWALQESGESVSGAIALLGDKKPKAKKTTATNLKTTNESNEDLQYIPDVAVGQNSRSMVAKLPPTSKDDEYRDNSCKSSDIDKQGLQYAPRVARRSRNCHENDESNEASDEIMDKKQSALNMKTESDGDEYDKVAEQSDQDDDAEDASNLEDGTAADSHRGVPRPREPHRNVEPGAFHADGCNARDVVVHDDDWTVDDEESTAQLMEIAGEMYDAEEDINHQVQQKLEEMQRNAPIGQVIAVDQIENDEVQDEMPIQSFWHSKRNRIAIFVIVFVCFGIVLGVILSKSPDSPTPSPVPNSCDESSSSLANRLPCVSQDNTGLNLQGNSLMGTIPIGIALMSNLSYLSLGGNSLTGTIPSTIGQLTKLTYLSLGGNSLTGTIPSEVGLLTKLTVLSLSSNSLTGTIPSQLGLLSKLNYLYLDSNSLRGTIPSQIVSLSNLSELSLYGNDLTGTIPSQIALMSNLSELYLSENSLKGTIPSQIAVMSNLSYLNLWDNSLMGTITSEVGLLTKLTYLDLWHNSLMGTIPSEVGLLSKLTYLDLSVNSLTGTIPSEVGLLSNLYMLYLYNNHFTGEFTCPAFIDDCWI